MELLIDYQEIEDAFDFVSFAQMGEVEAYLCTETGKIYLQSDFFDEEPEQLPDDIGSDKYIEIPHKNEFDLGSALVIDFAEQHLVDDVETIRKIFNKKGAYARFKDFLDSRDALDKWYAFEQQAQEVVLREWCAENEIQLK